MEWYKLPKNIENMNFIVNKRRKNSIMEMSVEILGSSFIKEYSIVINTPERQFHIFTTKSLNQAKKISENIIYFLRSIMEE